MLKKILIASVTVLGLAVPFAATPAANAGVRVEIERHRHHERCYEVEFRKCDREPWRCEGSFESRHRAHEVAEHLRCRGFEVRIIDRD